MKLLIVGNGGREHALAWQLAKTAGVTKIYVAPGNGGTASEAKCENLPIAATDTEKLAQFATANGIDLTVVGPELPLSLGIVDIFIDKGLKIFGPCREAAKLEGSKQFAKLIMEKSKVPTALYATFDNPSKAKDYVRSQKMPIVIKADTLAAGKGVTIAATFHEAAAAIDDILINKRFGESSLLIEEYLEGTEISMMVITDGKTVFLLPPSEDHKQVFDGDKGPNTGGMGAYSPTDIPIDEYRALVPLVITPVLDELASMGVTYTGVLYAGLMLTEDGAKVLEYNCRFGDPETQVILPRLQGDLLDILLKSVAGRLNEVDTSFSDNSSVCVVMASGGYPDDFQKNIPIGGIDEADKISSVKVLHSGTVLDNGVVRTAGGRVLSVVSTALKLSNALDAAYTAVSRISFENAHFRKDIAARREHG